MEKVGLIYGWGELPVIWAAEASSHGYKVISFPLLEEETADLTNLTEEVFPVNLGLLAKLINKLKNNNINKVVMLGKVRKSYLFKNPKLDCRMKKVLNSLDNLNDINILSALVEELENEGIEVLKQSVFMDNLMAYPGNLTKKEPASVVLEDMRYGFGIARKIAEMGIGQTVIIKDRSVLAVEAVEGTDRAIKRGGSLGGPGATMAKVSRPEHDFRFDIPTIGLQTLQNLENISAKGLVIEAERTFILNKPEFIKKANQIGISVVAMEFERG